MTLIDNSSLWNIKAQGKQGLSIFLNLSDVQLVSTFASVSLILIIWHFLTIGYICILYENWRAD